MKQIQDQIITKNVSLITTPIFYVNADPHIGHLYTMIYADAFARWQRQNNKFVFFQTGCDQHGSKIQKQAQIGGKNVAEYVKVQTQSFKSLAKQFDISYDFFQETSRQDHMNFVQKNWLKLENKGFIEKNIYQGYYCTVDEQFISDKDIKKRNDGQIMSSSGHLLEYLDEQNHLFNLNDIKYELKSIIQQNKTSPEHYIKSALQDLQNIKEISISRKKQRVYWGIPVPQDTEFTIYVWLDALLNYHSGIHTLKDNQIIEELKNNMTHFIGKDISKFHMVYWPSFLYALNEPQPKEIVVHDHWIKDGKKMSKSLGNVVDPFDLFNKYGSDPVRLFFLSEGPQNFDTDFELKNLQKKYNELIEKYINLIMRSISEKIFPNLTFDFPIQWEYSQLDKNYIQEFQKIVQKCQDFQSEKDFKKGYIQLELIFQIANKQFNDLAPWKEIDIKNQQKTIHLIMESIRIMAVLLEPYTPQLSFNVLNFLNCDYKSLLFRIAVNNQKLNFHNNDEKNVYIKLRGELKEKIFVKKI